MDSYQRVEEMVRRLTGGVRYVQVDLQDYRHPHPELVERLAAAIQECGSVYGIGLTLDEPVSRLLADAVIRELGLRQQVAGPDGIAYGQHRYVTEWSNDE